MINAKIKCKCITNLFAYGQYQNYPEFRATEIKGLMRYVYRIATRDYIHLNYESELFGGNSTVNNEETKIVPSPISIVVNNVNRHKTEISQFLLHENKVKLEKNRKKTIPKNTELNFQMRYFPSSLNKNIDFSWYLDLLLLAFTIGGIGQRSRKGRGSLLIQSIKYNIEKNVIFSNKKEVLNWIRLTLNKVASPYANGKYYYLSDNIIKPIIKQSTKSKDAIRPMIQKIMLGNVIAKSDINVFLKEIDQQCHEFKKPSNKNENFETYEKLHNFKSVTGMGSPKLASPLIISIIETLDGVYPIYTYVNSVDKFGKELDKECHYRDIFVGKLEKNGDD